MADDESGDGHGCGRTSLAGATLKYERRSVLVRVQVTLTGNECQQLVKYLHRIHPILYETTAVPECYPRDRGQTQTDFLYNERSTYHLNL